GGGRRAGRGAALRRPRRGDGGRRRRPARPRTSCVGGATVRCCSMLIPPSRRGSSLLSFRGQFTCRLTGSPHDAHDSGGARNLCAFGPARSSRSVGPDRDVDDRRRVLLERPSRRGSELAKRLGRVAVTPASPEAYYPDTCPTRPSIDTASSATAR